MKQKKIIFRDAEIIEFCRTTRDTNEIHDPVCMSKLGKRVIVPGMFALSQTVALSGDFMKSKARSLRVLFNSLLSSGDFVTLCAGSSDVDPEEIRLSAINHRDTLTSNNDYTRLSGKEIGFTHKDNGILRRLEVEREQVERFRTLIGTDDADIARFLYSVAYASQALLQCIDNPVTEVEKEIDRVICKSSNVSPFYHTLEIQIPSPFPVFEPLGTLDYLVHFERKKPFKLYVAHVSCAHDGILIFRAQYKLVGIADRIILRMAKPVTHGFFTRDV